MLEVFPSCACTCEHLNSLLDGGCKENIYWDERGEGVRAGDQSMASSKGLHQAFVLQPGFS